MFRPAIQQTRVLVVMALMAVGLFYLASSVAVEHVATDYDLKVRAAQRMQRAMTILKNERMAAAVFIDDVNDPNHTGLIGRQSSFITTDEGDLDSKISVLDPNVAAIMVDLLRQAGVGAGDTLAVTVSGSMPGANLAVYCA
ncbi:MAG: poly-gamma-glutamate system protein, partial [Candidatus Marinimicrobia bacterium]|nr:poly-gamma-glutamate system protein [Candidatus Neomarinimicrobiota bacterium]